MILTTALSVIAAALTLITFCMHGEYKIRAVAISANAASMAYTAFTYFEGTHSIAAFFLMHTTLLLINGYRLRRLIQKKIYPKFLNINATSKRSKASQSQWYQYPSMESKRNLT